jgi:hypothetical protein
MSIQPGEDAPFCGSIDPLEERTKPRRHLNRHVRESKIRGTLESRLAVILSENLGRRLLASKESSSEVQRIGLAYEKNESRYRYTQTEARIFESG